jgi:hypothetical protein
MSLVDVEDRKGSFGLEQFTARPFTILSTLRLFVNQPVSRDAFRAIAKLQKLREEKQDILRHNLTHAWN